MTEGETTGEGGQALLASQRLRVAHLLTLVGGFLDAYTYFMRGGVFANAQTGNIVKLGIAPAIGCLGAAVGLITGLKRANDRRQHGREP